jgi:D-alanine--poly(phosphoribitol) ligase subunit 1
MSFVVCTSKTDEKSLLTSLAKLVPDYMVPSKLVVMPKLPKNPNGKVDRQQLRNLLGN